MKYFSWDNDKNEKELLEPYEEDEWISMRNIKSEFQKYSEHARYTFKKDRRVNIRISTKDLEGIQKKALEEGLPYQSFIASILHKYVLGRLVEKS